MEYVQTVLVHVQAGKDAEASALLSDLDAHQKFLQQQPGFLGMRATRSTDAEGNRPVVVETHWRDNNSLADYTTQSETVASIVQRHEAITVPGSLQIFRMEAMPSGGGREAVETVYQRLALAILIPIGVFLFGLGVIYTLSRIYLEVGGNAATVIAGGIAVGILIVAWYFAANPGLPRWQFPTLALILAAALAGGSVYALSTDEEETHVVAPGSPPAGLTPGVPPPTPPGPGGPLVIDLGDNFFEFQGQEEPTVRAPAGIDVEITLNNGGTALHNMHVASSGDFESNFCTTGGDAPCSDPARIRGGQSGTISFNLPAGSYDFRCDFHPSVMKGTLELN